MGFFSDLKMAFNPSSRTKDYAARTARTIARNEGKKVSESRTAQNYMKKQGVTQADLGDTSLLSAKSSPSKSSPSTNIKKSLRPKVRPKPKVISIPGEGNVEVPRRNPFVGSLSAAEASAKQIFTPPVTNKKSKSSRVVPPRDGGNKKPNALGYGYYNRQGVWIPPDIDMQDGGGPGISGEVFGSRGGVEADTNNDGYVTAEEARIASEKGVFKYGIGRVSNAVGATPFGSGEAPTGIAGVIASGGILGSALGNEYKPRDRMFGPGMSMTQEQVDEYMKGVQDRRDQAIIDQQQLMLHGSPSDDRPASTEVVAEKAPDDPCPKGYMMDPETKQCVLDPFDTAFADPVTGGDGTVVTAGLSPYTQMAPVTLGQLQPTRVAAANPLAMQQANMPPQGGLGSLAPVTSRTS